MARKFSHRKIINNELFSYFDFIEELPFRSGRVLDENSVNSLKTLSICFSNRFSFIEKSIEKVHRNLSLRFGSSPRWKSSSEKWFLRFDFACLEKFDSLIRRKFARYFFLVDFVLIGRERTQRLNGESLRCAKLVKRFVQRTRIKSR